MRDNVERPAPAAMRTGVPFVRRIYGRGSVFAKAFRDSRRGFLIVAGWISLIVLVAGTATASTFGTVETRAEAIKLTTTLPKIFLGLYGGTQSNVVTLGGFMNWRYGVLFFLVPGFWSLFALSSTLVLEARRGSLEFVAASPLTRRRLALEKLGGHVAAMTAATIVIAVVIWLVGRAFAPLSAEDLAPLGATGGDTIPFGAALSYALLMGLVGLAAGAIAFALAPFVGRGAAAGVAGAVMFGSWVIYGYRESIQVFDALTPLSWYSWTAGHRPIAGVYDWPSLLPLVAIIVIGSAIGILAFERRDLGAIGSVRTPRMPRALLGIRGPLGRSFGDRLPGALAWGMGLGVYALAIGASGDTLRESIAENPAVSGLFQAAFPNLDINAPGIGLQLAFLTFGYLGIAIAAATMIGGWASDETEGRLELLLATTLARARWFARSALGVFVAIGVAAAVVALGIALGVATTGDDPLTPAVGTAVLALYAAAAAGIGIAIGGLWRTSVASVAVILVAVGTILLDILVPALQLPDWVHEFALTAHFGEPMLGNWDPVGIVASLVLAIGGLALGTWGFSRRDLKS